MAIVEKTFKAPFITVHDGDDMSSARTGLIIDSIQVTSDVATDDVTLDVTPLGGTSDEIKISSGDTVYGPFTAYEITGATDAATKTIVHERSNITTN